MLEHLRTAFFILLWIALVGIIYSLVAAICTWLWGTSALAAGPFLATFARSLPWTCAVGVLSLIIDPYLRDEVMSF